MAQAISSEVLNWQRDPGMINATLKKMLSSTVLINNLIRLSTYGSVVKENMPITDQAEVLLKC